MKGFLIKLNILFEVNILCIEQGSGIGSLQAQNGAYIPRQPHFSQPTSQQLYGQQQVYLIY